jgi:hypothetical protein
MKDPDDVDYVQTSVREFWEETGRVVAEETIAAMMKKLRTECVFCSDGIRTLSFILC